MRFTSTLTPFFRGLLAGLAGASVLVAVYLAYSGLHGLKEQSDRDHKAVAAVIDYLNVQISAGKLPK